MKIKSLFVLFVITLTLLAACSPAAAGQAPAAAASNTGNSIEAIQDTTPPATEAATAAPTPTAPPAAGSSSTGTTSAEETSMDATSDLPPAEIVNDEGGPVNITGEVNYTNAFFTDGVAQPVVILEDQAGFVDRNEFFIMPVESQTLGQITSDFYDPPFSYSIALPIEPQGTQRDVDHDGIDEPGVQVFAIAYWTNTFGDPYLEVRDLSGGGWSTAYASTLTSSDAETKREIVGGKLLIYAPVEGQGFPSGFGDDGLLFTEDDPLVAVPQGYTVVDLDTDPFTFDRARDQVIDLIEPDSAALVDYSDLSYTEAFDSLIEKLSKEYAFTEYKGVDWDTLHEDLRPLFEEADAEQDVQLYRHALNKLANSIPDGHVSGPALIDDFLEQTSGGLGIAVRELDDGRTIVNFLTPGSPAEEAGVELDAEIVAINGTPIADAISAAVPFSGPFSTEHVKRLQQMRYVTRFPLDTEVELTYINPGETEEQTATLTAVQEPQSFSFSSFSAGTDSFALPVEYELLPNSPYAYARINSFSDNDLLSIQLWERMIKTIKEQNVPGLIIDMRQNLGGSGFLADSMAAYFFEEPHILGNTGHYAEDIDDFYFDERGEQRFYLPAEELRYDGQVAVLVGPFCNSACEFFSYDMTVDERAAIVGQYPTAGLGGSVDSVRMPEGEMFRFTQGRAVNADGEIHIEGIGVVPTVQVPVTEETLFADGDPVLDAAVAYLDKQLEPEVIDAGELALEETAEAELEAGTRTQFELEVSGGQTIDILVESDSFDPGLLVLDLAGNVLLVNDNVNENTTTAGFEALEIPDDMTLVLHVVGLDDESAGAFSISAMATAE
ncbi:MAG: S41 family peptidase [Candidatus Promineifilaceae bacterium]